MLNPTYLDSSEADHDINEILLKVVLNTITPNPGKQSN